MSADTAVTQETPPPAILIKKNNPDLLYVFEKKTVLLAIAFWLERRTALFIYLSAASILIFRAELSILLGLFLLYDISFKRITISQ